MISLTSPVRTRAHRWPAGPKLAGLCLAGAGLFWIRAPEVLGAICAAIALSYLLPGPAFARAGARALRILWPFLAVIALWHLVTGTPREGAAVALRLLAAVGLANLVTMTTPLTEMIAVLHRLTAPLRRLGLHSAALEIAIALAVRFTPMLIERAGQLRAAWRTRSRRAPGWRIILPFTLMALDDADRVADALKARGALYRQNEE